MRLNELKVSLYVSQTPFLKARRRQDMDMSPLYVLLNIRLRSSVILWVLNAVTKPLINATMFFDSVQKGAPDVMYQLKVDVDADTDPYEVNFGVGIYLNDQGEYHELKAFKDVHCTHLYLERNPRLFSRAG